jgi:hypothetical protein
MQLREIFSNTFEWEWTTFSHSFATAQFSTPMEYSVIFTRVSEGSYFFGFDIKGSLDGEMTNQGVGSKVLGTVLDIVENFASQITTRQLLFYAKKEEVSRERVYDKILSRFSNKHNYTFEKSSTHLMGMDLIQYLIALDETLTEDIDNFRKWFRNSRVVDKKGNPHLVYHGSRYQFDKFDPNTTPDGFYFSSSREVAQEYSTGPIYEVYLSIQNPLVIDWKNQHGENFSSEHMDQYFERARSSQHDGLIIHNINDGWKKDSPLATTYIVFSPNQIKSPKSAYSHSDNIFENATYPLYHGTNIDNLWKIIQSGSLKPDYHGRSNDGPVGVSLSRSFEVAKSFADSWHEDLDYSFFEYFELDGSALDFGGAVLEFDKSRITEPMIPYDDFSDDGNGIGKIGSEEEERVLGNLSLNALTTIWVDPADLRYFLHAAIEAYKVGGREYDEEFRKVINQLIHDPRIKSMKSKLVEDVDKSITAYHITPTRNIPNIKKYGLVPRVGERSAKLSEKSSIFLFPTKDAAEDALMNWLGDEFDDIELSLLAVNIPTNSKLLRYEYQIYDTIPPNMITVLGDI